MDVLKDYEVFLTTEKKASANTLSSYLRDVRQFAAYLEREERALDDVTQSDVERYVKYLVSKGTKPGIYTTAAKESQKKLQSCSGLYGPCGPAFGQSGPKRGPGQGAA